MCAEPGRPVGLGQVERERDTLRRTTGNELDKVGTDGHVGEGHTVN